MVVCVGSEGSCGMVWYGMAVIMPHPHRVVYDCHVLLVELAWPQFYS